MKVLDRSPDALEQGALLPLIDRLISSAEARAEGQLRAGEADAELSLSHARQQVRAILSEAQLEGRRAAVRRTMAEMASARRRARETVLAAKRESYDLLKSMLEDRLEQLLRAPEGRQLESRLLDVVASRAASRGRLERTGSASVFVADSGIARAEILLSRVADHVIAASPDVMERLWR